MPRVDSCLTYEYPLCSFWAKEKNIFIFFSILYLLIVIKRKIEIMKMKDTYRSIPDAYQHPFPSMREDFRGGGGGGGGGGRGGGEFGGRGGGDFGGCGGGDFGKGDWHSNVFRRNVFFRPYGGLYYNNNVYSINNDDPSSTSSSVEFPPFCFCLDPSFPRHFCNDQGECGMCVPESLCSQCSEYQSC